MMLRHTEFTKLRVKVRLELGIILSLGKFDISYSGEGNFDVLILHAPITTTIIYDDLTFFPNKLKMSLDSRFCKLIPDSRWSFALFLPCETEKRPKNKTDKKISGL